MAEVKNVKINVTSNIKNVSSDTKTLNKDLATSTKGAGNLSKETSNIGGSAGGVGALTGSLGKLSPALGGATGAASGLLKVLWALVANPIGAIIAAVVLALTALYKAFSSTKTLTNCFKKNLPSSSRLCASASLPSCKYALVCATP